MICERQQYATEIGFECLNSCIYNYLFNENFDIHKSDIFFYGEGFNVFYNALDFFPTISSLMYESNFKFLTKSGIDYSIGNFNNHDSAIEFLKSSIREENLLSIKVKSNHLTHSPIFTNSQAAPHFINPIGIDMTTKRLFISDGDIPYIVSTTYQGWVDLEQVIKAWAEMDYYYVIISPSAKLHMKESDIKREAEKEFLTGISRYLNSNREHTEGWSVILRLFKTLEHYLEEKNSLFNQFALNINYQLKIYGFFTIKKYISDFLEYKKISNELQENYNQILGKWYCIDKYLIKVGITKDCRHMVSLIEKVQKISYEENSILQDIANLCEMDFNRG